MVDFTDPTTVAYTLIAIGVIMFLIEATMPGFFIAVPATILIILGVTAFYVPLDRFLAIAPIIVVLVGVPATAVTIWAYRKMAPPSQGPTTRTADTLAGAVGRVTRSVDPDSTKGKVRLGREVWSATTDADVIPEGARVRVSRVDGIILVVEPADTLAGGGAAPDAPSEAPSGDADTDVGGERS